MIRSGLDGVDELAHGIQNGDFPAIKNLPLKEAQDLLRENWVSGYSRMERGKGR